MSAYTPSPGGWIRAVREALGMSLADLGARMPPTESKVRARTASTAQSAHSAKRSETVGTIQLSTLRRAAAALDCTFVYVLIPNRSLERTMADQAARVLDREAAAAAASAALEAHTAQLAAASRRELINRVIDAGRLWRVR